MKPFLETSRLLFQLSLALATILPIASRAQTSAALPKNATAAEITARWKNVSRDELRKAAEGGQADAQLEFGRTEIEIAREENSDAFQWTLKALSKGDNLSEKEEADARSKWK